MWQMFQSLQIMNMFSARHIFFIFVEQIFISIGIYLAFIFFLMMSLYFNMKI